MEKTVYESNVPRVYTLYRVSTIGQVEKDDIPMQKQVCRDFAKKQGWVVVKEFSEKGISGYKVSAKTATPFRKFSMMLRLANSIFCSCSCLTGSDDGMMKHHSL